MWNGPVRRSFIIQRSEVLYQCSASLAWVSRGGEGKGLPLTYSTRAARRLDVADVLIDIGS